MSGQYRNRAKKGEQSEVYVLTAPRGEYEEVRYYQTKAQAEKKRTEWRLPPSAVRRFVPDGK